MDNFFLTINYRFAAAWLLCLSAGFGCGARAGDADISGVYVAASPSDVEMVQIIKTPDGRIVGRIETTTLDEKGDLETKSFSMEGAAGGNQVTLSTKSILFNGDLSLTGFVDGDLLDLAWEGGRQTYERSDSYGYQAAVTGLRAQAGQVIASLSAEKARTAHSELAEIVARLEARAPAVRRQLDDAADDYKRLYGRYHNRRRAADLYWSSDSPTGYARQADTEARRADTAIWRLDQDIRRLYDAFGADIRRAYGFLASIKTHCAEYGAAGNGLCDEASAKGKRLGAVSDSLQAAFDTLAEKKENASVDVPPGQKLLKKIFD